MAATWELKNSGVISTLLNYISQYTLSNISKFSSLRVDRALALYYENDRNIHCWYETVPQRCDTLQYWSTALICKVCVNNNEFEKRSQANVTNSFVNSGCRRYMELSKANIHINQSLAENGSESIIIFRSLSIIQMKKGTLHIWGFCMIFDSQIRVVLRFYSCGYHTTGHAKPLLSKWIDS